MLARQVVNLPELRKTKKDLTQEQNSLENFFKNNLDLMAIANRNGELLQINNRWQALFGFSVDEMMGRSITLLVNPDDMDRTLQFMSLLSASNAGIQFTSRLRTKSNQDTGYFRCKYRGCANRNRP